MTNELTVALEAVRKASEKAMYYFKNLPPVTIKPDNTPVTKADKETETVIREYISSKFPNASFVGEEHGGIFGEGDVWIIDPIDGTKNFIRGIPLWAILVALWRDGEVVAGISYMPAIDELLYAEKGSGAFLNGKRISVSKIENIKDSTITHTGNPFKFKNPEQVGKLLNSSLHARGFGDAYSYHLVATGRADINFEPEVSVWDVAGFKLIIEEAGGKITTLTGSPWTVDIKDFVATNGLVHNEVIKILNENL